MAVVLLSVGWVALPSCGAPPQLALDDPAESSVEIPVDASPAPQAAPAAPAEIPEEPTENPDDAPAENPDDLPADPPPGGAAEPDAQLKVREIAPCPPCPPPMPGCVGTGPCGCGPWVCEDGGAPSRSSAAPP